jgi:hypothetical protein
MGKLSPTGEKQSPANEMKSVSFVTVKKCPISSNESSRMKTPSLYSEREYRGRSGNYRMLTQSQEPLKDEGKDLNNIFPL